MYPLSTALYCHVNITVLPREVDRKSQKCGIEVVITILNLSVTSHCNHFVKSKWHECVIVMLVLNPICDVNCDNCDILHRVWHYGLYLCLTRNCCVAYFFSLRLHSKMETCIWSVRLILLDPDTIILCHWRWWREGVGHIVHNISKTDNQYKHGYLKVSKARELLLINIIT